MRTAVQSLALLVALTALAWGQSPAATPHSQPIAASYAITPIGDPNADSNLAVAISSNGIITGTADFRGDDSPFLYQNGTLTILSYSCCLNDASGVNSRAQVVSTNRNGSNTFSQAMLYTDSEETEIPVPNSTASGINDWGCVVGSSTTNLVGSFPWMGYVYCNGTVMTLPSLPDCVMGSTFARAINAAGQIVGESDTSGGCQRHAFLYQHGVVKDLGTLGGNASYAYAISTNGLVTGASITTGGATHAFLVKGRKMKDLGVPSGCVYTYGFGVNRHGTVVGYCDNLNPDTPEVAIVYDGKKFVDLNTLIPSGTGWNLRRAFAINDRGQIVGWGTHGEPANFGYYMGFLLTPVSKKQP